MKHWPVANVAVTRSSVGDVIKSDQVGSSNDAQETDVDGIGDCGVSSGLNVSFVVISFRLFFESTTELEIAGKLGSSDGAQEIDVDGIGD